MSATSKSRRHSSLETSPSSLMSRAWNSSGLMRPSPLRSHESNVMRNSVSSLSVSPGIGSPESLRVLHPHGAHSTLPRPATLNGAGAECEPRHTPAVPGGMSLYACSAGIGSTKIQPVLVLQADQETVCIGIARVPHGKGRQGAELKGGIAHQDLQLAVQRGECQHVGTGLLDASTASLSENSVGSLIYECQSRSARLPVFEDAQSVVWSEVQGIRLGFHVSLAETRRARRSTVRGKRASE